jgi:hypothetical protein
MLYVTVHIFEQRLFNALFFHFEQVNCFNYIMTKNQRDLRFTSIAYLLSVTKKEKIKRYIYKKQCKSTEIYDDITA